MKDKMLYLNVKVRLFLLALVAILGCAPQHHFILSEGIESFPARPANYPIEFIGAGDPPRAYVVVGMVTGVSRGTTDLFPVWEKTARRYGGDALWQVEYMSSHDVWVYSGYYGGYASVHTEHVYRAKVIRYLN
jgi:hypothetical protein